MAIWLKVTVIWGNQGRNLVVGTEVDANWPASPSLLSRLSYTTQIPFPSINSKENPPQISLMEKIPPHMHVIKSCTHPCGS